MEEETKFKKTMNEAARIFAYQCDPKEWKSFTPIHRSNGFKAGFEYQTKRVLVLIDSILLDTESEALKALRRKILEIE